MNMIHQVSKQVTQPDTIHSNPNPSPDELMKASLTPYQQNQ